MDSNRFYELFTEGWSHIEFEVLEQEDIWIDCGFKNKKEFTNYCSWRFYSRTYNVAYYVRYFLILLCKMSLNWKVES